MMNTDKNTVQGRTADRMRDPSMKTAETFNNDCLISLVLNCAVGCGWMYASPFPFSLPSSPPPTPKSNRDSLTQPQMGHAAAQQNPPAVRHQGLHDQRLLRRVLVPLLLDGPERQGGRVPYPGARHGRVSAGGRDAGDDSGDDAVRRSRAGCFVGRWFGLLVGGERGAVRFLCVVVLEVDACISC